MMYVYTIKSDFSENFSDLFSAESDLVASSRVYRMVFSKIDQIRMINKASTHLFRIGIYAECSGDLQSTEPVEVPFMDLIQDYLDQAQKAGDQDGEA